MAFYEKYMHITYIYSYIYIIDKNHSGCLNIKFYKSLFLYKLFFFKYTYATENIWGLSCQGS